MIISFSHRFAFVAVPKVAGHAIRHALRPLLAANDWEQCTRYERRLFPVPGLAEIGHGHLSWREVQPFLLPGMWARFFTFAAVRDPYDRFLSYAHFLHAQSAAWRDDPVGMMKRDVTDPRRREHILLRPQHHFLCDDDGMVAVDFVARYETLQADFETICARIGIATAILPRVNEVPRDSAVRLDAELIGLIEERYARDFEIFGYRCFGEPR